MKKLRENYGITLIALVITIIVLLILAGVSIIMLTGENGILIQAQKAKEENKKSTEEEIQKIGQIENIIDNYEQNIIIEKVIDDSPGKLEGEGTEQSPYVISSIEDLLAFSYDVRQGNTYNGKFVNLKQNLDFMNELSYVNANSKEYGKYGYDGNIKQILTQGKGFIPIGRNVNNSSESTEVKKANNFAGTFNGGNFTICNLYINEKTNENKYYGLFAANTGIIKNLQMSNCNLDIEGNASAVATIVGCNYGTIENCIVSGQIKNKGTSWLLTGGVTAKLEEDGKIINCGNMADITCENIGTAGQAVAAGIVGTCNHTDEYISTVQNCFNSGKIISISENSDTMAGGISVLLTNSNVQNCYNTGDINAYGIKTIYLGGISGTIHGSNAKNICKNLYNTGNLTFNGVIEGKEGYIGGIVGKNYNITIKNVFNTGKIEVEKGNKQIRIGGITAGYGGGNIENGYNVGKIETKDIDNETIGGITGFKLGNCINCNFLTGTYKKGIGKLGEGQKDEGVEEKESLSDFPSILEVVNEEGAFKENSNGEDPILNWQ